MKTRLQNKLGQFIPDFLQPGFKKYFFNTGWVFLEKMLRLIAGLFVGAYVARHLGPAQYGLLNYVISLVTLFTVMATLGLDGIIIRELVKNEQKRNVLLGTGFILKLSAAILVFIILVLFVQVTSSDNLTRNLVYIVAAGCLFETFNIIDFFFQSKVKSKYVVWSQSAALTVISVFRVILILKEASLAWFAWSYTLDFFILAAGLVFFYTRENGSIFSWTFDSLTARELLRSSWPMIIIALSMTVYMKIDQVMIKWMLGDEANGNYGVAVRLTEIWNFIPMAICSSVFPAILNAKEISTTLYMKRMQQLFDLMVFLSVSVALGTTFLSHFVVTILFGNDYAAASKILTLYIWSGVFLFLSIANGKWILSENLQVFRMVTLIVACVLNIVLNFFFIHWIGLSGAALSTLISYAFAGYLSFLFTTRTRPLFIMMSRSFNPLRIIMKDK